MKFIKTTDKCWINAECVYSIFVREQRRSGEYDFWEYDVVLNMKDGDEFIWKSFPDETIAEAWIDSTFRWSNSDA